MYIKQEQFAPCKVIGIPESGKLLLEESRILGIQLKKFRIPLTIGIRNPSSTDKRSEIQ